MLTVCLPLNEDAAVLLALAMWPDAARMQVALGRYASDPELQVWGWQVEGRTVCAAGLRVVEQSAEILHIGTRADSRQKGHARNLLLAVAERLNLTRLEAETDDGAVEFYIQAGFRVQETAGRGGIARYHCTLSV